MDLSGSTIVVGSWSDDDLGENAGSAWVYERQADGSWPLVAKLLASDGEAGDQFGLTVRVSGTTAFVAAYASDPLGSVSGSVYVFERQPDGAWLEAEKLTPSDGSPNDVFGSSMDTDGTTLAVAALRHDHVDEWLGAVYVFERDETGAWVEMQELRNPRGEEPFTNFGRGVAVLGDVLIVGGTTGPPLETEEVAWVFERDAGGEWAPTAALQPEEAGYRDFFGTEIALGDGYALFGGLSADGVFEDEGAAWIFTRDADGTWTEIGKLKPPALPDGAFFGAAVDVSGERALIGAYGTDGFTGAAWLYTGEACALGVSIEAASARPGDELRVEAALDHNRLRTVTVPLALWVEAPDGSVIARRVTPPLTLRHGDSVRHLFRVALPPGLAPGEYRVSVGIAEMEQGIATAWATFRIAP